MSYSRDIERKVILTDFRVFCTDEAGVISMVQVPWEPVYANGAGYARDRLNHISLTTADVDATNLLISAVEKRVDTINPHDVRRRNTIVRQTLKGYVSVELSEDTGLHTFISAGELVASPDLITARAVESAKAIQSAVDCGQVTRIHSPDLTAFIDMAV